MDLFVSLVLFLLLSFSGCTLDPQVTELNKDDAISIRSELRDFKQKAQQKHTAAPSLALPPVYEKVSIFDENKITLSASNARLITLLHSISKLAGLNLIVDSDVPIDVPITLSVHEADLKDVLKILMNISGSYYKLQGNILHVKQYMRKSFLLPYVHSDTSFQTDLGGDMLSSASSGSGSGQGIKGDFSMKFANQPKQDFYTQIENNIKKLLSKNGEYTINKFTGLMTVYDQYKNIQTIEKFLKKIKKQTSKQVLIEAKILEVVLNDGHSLGVSWDAIANNIAKAGDQLHIQQGLALTGAVAGTVNYTKSNFSAIINALDTAGNVDTLSNPRIKVLSGQSAIISSGKLMPFWEKEVQTAQGTGGSASSVEVTYNRRDVLDGLSLGVTTTIMEDGKIMLNVIPITSSIEDVVNHTDEKGNIVATAPIINIKEAGTIIQANDNDLVLIGGLINNTENKKEDKVPLLGDIPFFGGLFKKTVITKVKRELVILIRLKIVQ